MGPIEVRSTEHREVVIDLEVAKDEYIGVAMPLRRAVQLAAEILWATTKALVNR